MKNKLSLAIFLLLVGIISFVLSPGVSKAPPGGGRNCEELSERDGAIQLFFPFAPYNYRKSGYEYYIPYPDMRTGHAPGQATIFPTDFYCTVKVTSPSCEAFQWHGAYENPGNNLNIKLPPIGYDAVIEVKYIERGEDFTTPDFNQAVFWEFSIYQYSRVVYGAKKILTGGSGTILIELEILYNQGYDLDASGQIKTYLWTGGKGDYGDMSGLNSYIDINNMNFTGI